MYIPAELKMCYDSPILASITLIEKNRKKLKGLHTKTLRISIGLEDRAVSV